MKLRFIKHSSAIVALLTVFLWSCRDWEPGDDEVNGSVTFDFQSAINSSGRLATDEEVSSTIVTIASVDGNIIYESEWIDIVQFGEEFVSEPISLEAGDYQLTKFILLNKDGDAIYASPIESSEFAYLVENPLFIDFTVNNNETTKVIPEVLSTKESSPASFGYATFSFTPVETFNFLVGVFAYDTNTLNFELTEAPLTITSAEDTLYVTTLSASTNNLRVNDGFDTYTLTIKKPGFSKYQMTFNNEELKAYFEASPEGPLEIVLKESTLEDGLVSLYDFKVGFDAGIITGATFTEDRNGNAGSSLNFNGRDHQVEVPQTLDFSNNQMTVSAWVTPKDFYSGPCQQNYIIGNVESNNPGVGNWFLAYGDNVNDGHQCRNFSPDKTSFWYRISFDDGSAGGVADPAFIALDQAYLAVGTYDGSVARLYVNGVLVGSQENNKTLSATPSPYIIGKGLDHPNLPYNLNGNIDEIRLYNRALTADEVLELYEL